MASINTEVLDNLITGYLPHSIYAFETHTYPNYLKIGDTNRKVSKRLAEWKKVYKDLEQKFEAEAMIEDEQGEKNIFFRDYAVHNFLINDKKHKRLSDFKNESEFFQDTSVTDVEEGISEIQEEYKKDGIRKYTYYYVKEENSQVEEHYERIADYDPRPNQRDVISNIVDAVQNKRREKLLLYAVMRFGKSNVAIWSAKKLESKITVIVTGKADVKNEWKKTVESHKDFKNFIFTTASEFNQDFFKNHPDNNLVVFATLQDLAGSRQQIKEKHQFLLSSLVNLLVIDESHFGARAKIYSQAIEKHEDDVDELNMADETFNEAIDNVNSLNSEVKLHLSGTPYRILLSGEFQPEDIVGKIQFSDILTEKNKWIEEHTTSSDIVDADEEPWENPYFGFPQMIRFAFTPNESSIKMLEDLREQGKSAELNELFSPDSTAKSRRKSAVFKHESNVLSLLKAIDGSNEDQNIFPFLDYDKIQSGKLTQHMVFVLPYKNSCDAMERMIASHQEDFNKLGEYHILNVAGNTSKFGNPSRIQEIIKRYALEGKKTITLTVNKMLTGSTIPEWDTMIFLKDTKSPQEYDQAIFRLQSPWTKEIKEVETEKLIGREDMKPQTLLIDFSPNRMFKIESDRAIVINAAEGLSGNDQQEEELSKNILVSPIIYIDRNKLKEVTPTDIISKIREYSENTSIIDEVTEIPVDTLLYSIPEIRAEISRQEKLGSNAGLETKVYDDHGEGSSPEDIVSDDPNLEDEISENKSANPITGDELPLPEQMQTYYARILFYTFLSKEREKNLASIVKNIDVNMDNKRLAKHLGLNKAILELFKNNLNWGIRSTLDNKIENVSDLRIDSNQQNILKGIKKFGRISLNEIFTPEWVADKMVNILATQEFINDYKENPVNIIDLTSKSGVYLIKMYEKLLCAGIEHDVLKERLFAVATSHTGYEFTKAVFDDYNWNPKNLADSDVLNSYKLISEGNVGDELNKIFGDEDMKFDVVIGNPPYHNQGTGVVARNEPIYHKFMEAAYTLSSKSIFITPGRFLFNAGQTPKNWNDKMLEDVHVKVEYFEKSSAKVFPNTDIKGGVAVTLRDTDVEFGAIGTFTYIPELSSILEKVTSADFLSFNNLLYGKSTYKFSDILYKKNPKLKGRVSSSEEKSISSNIFKKLPEIFFNEKQNDNQVGILGRENSKRVTKWINREYIDNHPNLDNYKVLLPATNGSGDLGEALATPIVGSQNLGYTQTFISFGSFTDKVCAENLLKYVKTKFLRVLLSTMKVTQHNQTKEVWKNIPLQDFTSESDIDWTKSISEIDDILFKKYEFTEKNIEFIKTNVIEMS